MYTIHVSRKVSAAKTKRQFNYKVQVQLELHKYFMILLNRDTANICMENKAKQKLREQLIRLREILLSLNELVCVICVLTRHRERKRNYKVDIENCSGRTYKLITPISYHPDITYN